MAISIHKPTPEAQTYFQIFMLFLRFGLQAWGGPLAQIAMLRKELVEEEHWVTQERFNRSLAVYQVLPVKTVTLRVIVCAGLLGYLVQYLGAI